MLRLHTLGGVGIEGPAGPMTGAVAQRRPLALLALLAASERGMTRDQLIAYLWPDDSAERARQALAQLLHRARRELGEEAVDGDDLTVRLNPLLISSDIADFREAVSTNDPEKAVELYTGSFLDGFSLSGCEAFERWSEETRSELAQRVRELLEMLAGRASDRGEVSRAADYWRRVARVAPFDSRVALSLMRSLVAAGDRTGAIEHARIHESMMRVERDAPTDPSIGAYVASLKSPGAATSLSMKRPATDDDARATSAPIDVVEAVDAPVVVAPRADRRRWVTAAAFILGLATLATIGAVFSLRSPSEVPRRWVLIADAENATGDAAFDRTMPVALAAAIAQSRRLYPMPPDRIKQALLRMRQPGADSALTAELAREIAQREGVTAVAIPSAERSGEGFDLSVRLIDPATGGVMSLSFSRAENRAAVIDALDKLGRDLRRQLGESRFSIARSSAPLPLVTTVSLDALHRFAEGGRAFNAARYDEAAALWNQAVSIDTGFASAHASLGMLAYFSNRASDGARSYAKALALTAPLPEREQLRIRASAEGWRGNRDSAAALLRPYVESHPSDLDMLNLLGYQYLRAGKDVETESVLKQVTALDSLNYAALINLATVQRRLGRYGEALANYRRGFALDPAQDVANNNLNLEYGGTYVFNRQLDSARAVFNRLLASPDTLRQARALRSLAFLDMYQGRFHSAAGRLTTASDMMRAVRQGVSEIRNRLLLAQALEHTGPERMLRLQLDAAHDVALRIDAPVPILLWVGKALARSGEVNRAEALLRSLGSKMQKDIGAERGARDVLEGEVLLARGKAQEALPLLRAGYDADRQSHALESLAYGLAAAGAVDSAAVRYSQLESETEFGWEAQIFAQLAAYWLGRVEEARNNVRGAREAYARFIDRWKDGDLTLELVTDARSRLSRLSASIP